MSGAVLITGATGFIGGATLKALLSVSRHSVMAAGRTANPNATNIPFLSLDLGAPSIELPPGIETVVHLAGEKRDVQRMQAVNSDGAARLAQAAGRAGAQRFVHLSSVGVYGARKHSGVVTESHAHDPQDAYEASKDAGERRVQAVCAEFGVRCVVLQPSNVVGLGGPGRPLLGLMRMVARGWFSYFGGDEAWVNYVAVEDVAASLVTAVTHPQASGVYVVNTPARLRALIEWVADELGRRPPRARLPYWAGKVAVQTGALASTLLGRDLPFTPGHLRELTNTTRYDGSAITRCLDFAYPLGIEAALRAMVRQYRQEGLV